MRAIEERILACLEKGIVGQHRLSDHDWVGIYQDGTKSYRLWGTELYHKTCDGREFYYFSNRAADTCDCMSATTASRINALMYHTPCSVYRRDGKIYEWATGNQLRTNHEYKVVDGHLVLAVWSNVHDR